MLQYILDLKQIDIDVVDDLGLTPLLCAAKTGNLVYVIILLKNTECSLTATDSDGNNVLHLSASSGNAECVLELMNQAEERNVLNELVNGLNKHNQTCLHLAAQKSLSTVLQELLKHGADLNVEDTNGYLPSMYTTRDSQAALCLLILETYGQMLHEIQLDELQASVVAEAMENSDLEDSTINPDTSMNVDVSIGDNVVPPASNRFSLPLMRRAFNSGSSIVNGSDDEKGTNGHFKSTSLHQIVGHKISSWKKRNSIASFNHRISNGSGGGLENQRKKSNNGLDSLLSSASIFCDKSSLVNGGGNSGQFLQYYSPQASSPFTDASFPHRRSFLVEAVVEPSSAANDSDTHGDDGSPLNDSFDADADLF